MLLNDSMWYECQPGNNNNNNYRLGVELGCRIICSVSPSPFPLDFSLWIWDFGLGFGTWILDLGLELGLDNILSYHNRSKKWVKSFFFE